MQHVLRGIHGPHAGALYVLENEHTLLGRASDADIQLAHEGVAVHHARIERTHDGGFVLVDLATQSGTYVGIKRVTRHLLREGETFRIMGSRYAFEVRRTPVQTSSIFRSTASEASQQDASSVAANDTATAWPRQPLVEIISEDTRRSSQRPTREIPRLVADDPVDAANDPRWTPTLLIEEVLDEVLAEQGGQLDEQSGAHQLDAAFWERVERELDEEGAFGHSDSFAILDRIREYRELRVRALEGRPLSPIENRRLEVLRRQLKPGRVEDKRPITARRHQRFSCHLSAQLLSRVGGRLVSRPVALLNISAGGAKLGFGGDLVKTGDQSWLAVPLEDEDGRYRRAVVFRSRVVWTRQPQAQLGVIFSGLPRLSPDAPQVAAARQ